jgi:hypothetical protein
MGNTTAITTASTKATKIQITKQTTGATDHQDPATSALSHQFLVGTQRAIQILTKEKMLLITVAQFSRILVTDEIKCQLPATVSGHREKSKNSLSRKTSEYICAVEL